MLRDIYLFLIVGVIGFISSDSPGEKKLVVKPLMLEEDIFFRIVEPEVLSYFYKIRQAKDFGGSFNASYHNVPLVLVDPPDACSPVVNTLSVCYNIALIKRGGCSFLTKTVNAEEAGAIAVIIADSDEEAEKGMVDMVHDGTERRARIPAAFMIGKSGQMIRAKLNELGYDRALIDIPVNASAVPNIHVHQPPWSLW